MHREAIWAEPFAVMRHHPAFKYYSRQKYGNPEALAEKITTRLLREICLLYKSSFSQRLLTNYQEANYKDLLLCAILAGDKYLIEFAGANQELTLYNHHYHDGMNGEGAQNYMAMLNSYYYPYMSNPDGWQRLDPDSSSKILSSSPLLANGINSILCAEFSLSSATSTIICIPDSRMISGSRRTPLCPVATGPASESASSALALPSSDLRFPCITVALPCIMPT